MTCARSRVGGTSASGPITDPAVLRKVAHLIVAWQERQAEGKELQDARLLR